MSVTVRRTGPRSYVGTNARGAKVVIGPQERDGVHFTPGDLLRLALGGCTLMSTDKVIERRLGEGFEASAEVATKDAEGENRFEEAQVVLTLDLSGLDPEQIAALGSVVAKAAERGCTVGRSLRAGVPHTLSITAGPADPSQERP